MTRGLDFDKAVVALRRAAEKATHGTREERSGRFRSDEDYTLRRGEGVVDTKIGRKEKSRKA